MLPLELRNNKLIAIHIRVFDLEYDRYKLKLECENVSFTSVETPKTILPKFEIDKVKNKDLSNFLLTTNKAIFKFILTKKDENIDEFVVNLSELTFLCKDLSETRIIRYPIIIFEFSEGYFLTNTHYESNINYIDQNLNVLKKPPIRKELQFMVLDKKFKEFDFFQRQNKINIERKEESIENFRSEIRKKHTLLNKHTKNYESMKNIHKMKNQIFEIQENIKKNQHLIDVLRKIVVQKKNDLKFCNDILTMCKDHFKDKIAMIESEKKTVEKYVFRKNAIKLKKNAEIAYIFFNRYCGNLYKIPMGFEIISTKGQTDDKLRFFERTNKTLSVMFGIIAFMINQIAKLYDISLKYPLFINGSKSYILYGKKEFIALFYNKTLNERNTQFDVAIDLLYSNLSQILLYFNICSYKELKLFNIFTLFLKLHQFFQSIFSNNSLEVK